MDRWLNESGRSVLFEALTNAWDRIEGDFRNACLKEAVKNSEVNGELEALRVRVANVDRLEKQNKALKEELSQHNKSVQRQATPRKTFPRTPLNHISAGSIQNNRRSIKYDHLDVTNLSLPDLLSEYSKLEEKYHRLRTQFADSIDVNERLQEQCREKAKAYENWKQHANTLEGQVTARNKKIERLKIRLAAVTHNDAAATISFTSDTGSVVEEDRGSSDARLESTNVQVSNASTIWPPTIPNTEHEPSLPPLPTTHGPEPCHSLVKQEPSSDAPMITDERVILKRRRDTDLPVQTTATTKIKTESDSDPIITEEQHLFMPHESIDFDATEETVPTPRKNKKIRPVSDETRPPTSNCASPLLDQSSVSACIQEHGREAMHHHDRFIRDQEMQRQDNANVHDRSSALYPLSISTLYPKTDARKPLRAVGSSLRRGIASLAEDDDDDDENHTSLLAAPRSGRAGRLETLLNTTSTNQAAVALPFDIHPDSVPTTHAFHIELPPRRVLPFDKRGLNNVRDAFPVPETPSLSTSKRSSSVVKPRKKYLDAPTKGTEKQTTPLRERPISSLRREDFKVNSKYNDGLDFAFTDVVRNKNDRACLSGCTKEACCGKYFRQQAHIERETTGDKEFEALLTDYLGTESWKLDIMTADQKEKLWIEAKIRELANKYGKHRVRYDRMVSPPGYWRADFPSTQENIEDNEKAKRMEFEVVEERYREALKKGRWLFRDENP